MKGKRRNKVTPNIPKTPQGHCGHEHELWSPGTLVWVPKSAPFQIYGLGPFTQSFSNFMPKKGLKIMPVNGGVRIDIRMCRLCTVPGRQ